MATIDDQATEREESDRELALKLRKPTLQEVGVCYNCSETIQKGNFCDADCREDWEKRKRFNGLLTSNY